VPLPRDARREGKDRRLVVLAPERHLLCPGAASRRLSEGRASG